MHFKTLHLVVNSFPPKKMNVEIKKTSEHVTNSITLDQYEIIQERLTNIIDYNRNARGVMVIVARNGHGSNPGRD